MKLIVKLLAILIIGLVALGVAGYFLIPPAADKAVDEGSRYAFGVPADIGKISASPGIGSTSVGFEEYVLKSPTGFTEPLLSIGKFSLGVGTKSLIGDTKEVGVLLLKDVNLTLVQDGTQNNLVPVLRHLQGLGGANESQAPDGPREGAAGPKLRIGKIQVENVGATLKLAFPGLDAMEKTFTIPPYEKDWSDVTGDGVTVAEIGGLLLKDLEERAMASAEGVVPAPVLSALSKTLAGGLEGGLQGGIDAAKGLVTDEAQKQLDAAEGKADELLKDGQEKAGEALKGVEDKAKELIGDPAKDLLKGIGGGAEDATKKASEKAKKGLKGLLGGDGLQP